MASTNQINKVVELIVVLGDLLILNFCLFLLLFFWKKAFNSLPFSCTVSLMMTSLSLCYLACSASRGTFDELMDTEQFNEMEENSTEE